MGYLLHEVQSQLLRPGLAGHMAIQIAQFTPFVSGDSPDTQNGVKVVIHDDLDVESIDT